MWPPFDRATLTGCAQLFDLLAREITRVL